MDLPPRDANRNVERWPPENLTWDKPEWDKPEWDMAGWGVTIWRGIRCRCPACARTPIFDGYLKVHLFCAVCHAPLGEMPADDAPPYIAMLAVAHVIGVVVVLIFHFGLAPNRVTYGCLLFLLIGVCMIALRIAKGAVIGILLKLGRKREALL